MKISILLILVLSGCTVKDHVDTVEITCKECKDLKVKVVRDKAQIEPSS